MLHREQTSVLTAKPEKQEQSRIIVLAVLTAILAIIVAASIYAFDTGFSRYLVVSYLIVVLLVIAHLNRFKINITAVFAAFILLFLCINILFYPYVRQVLGRAAAIDSHFPRALLIVTFTAESILLGYLVGHLRFAKNIAASIVRKTLPSQKHLDRMKTVGSLLALLGAILLIVSLFLMDIFPLLEAEPIAAKYFAEDYHQSYEKFSYLFRIGINLIIIGGPFLVVDLLVNRFRKIWPILCLAVAFLAIFITLRKGLILNILIISFFVDIWRRASFRKIIAWSFVFLITLFVLIRMNVYFYPGPADQALIKPADQALIKPADQALIQPADEALVRPKGAFENLVYRLGEGIADFQDFVLTLSLFDGHDFYYGKTYLASIIPLPPGLSSFRNNYTIANVTKHLMGLGSQSVHGGLRIFFFGEAFLNFGYIGVIVISLLFGWFLSVFNFLEIHLRKIKANPFYALLFILLFYFCIFTYYQSGTCIDNIFSIFFVVLFYTSFSGKFTLRHETVQ